MNRREKRYHVLTLICIWFLMMGIGVYSGLTMAEDDEYKRGHDQSYVAGCENPTTRTDGTPLPVAEIERVEYYIDDVVPADYDSLGNPLLTILMPGGCSDSIVDLQQFPSRTTLYKFAFTFDTDGNKSPTSAGRSFIIHTANPNAPGNVR